MHQLPHLVAPLSMCVPLTHGFRPTQRTQRNVRNVRNDHFYLSVISVVASVAYLRTLGRFCHLRQKVRKAGLVLRESNCVRCL